MIYYFAFIALIFYWFAIILSIIMCLYWFIESIDSINNSLSSFDNARLIYGFIDTLYHLVIDGWIQYGNSNKTTAINCFTLLFFYPPPPPPPSICFYFSFSKIDKMSAYLTVLWFSNTVFAYLSIREQSVSLLALCHDWPFVW